MPVNQFFTIVHPLDPKLSWEMTREQVDVLYNELRDALGIGAQVVETPLPQGLPCLAQTLEAVERRIAAQQVAPHQSGNSVGVASTGG